MAAMSVSGFSGMERARSAVLGATPRIRRVAVIPLSSGRLTSMIATSGVIRETAVTASAAVAARPTISMRGDRGRVSLFFARLPVDTRCRPVPGHRQSAASSIAAIPALIAAWLAAIGSRSRGPGPMARASHGIDTAVQHTASQDGDGERRSRRASTGHGRHRGAGLEIASGLSRNGESRGRVITRSPDMVLLSALAELGVGDVHGS
jgi:hypothetical protein